MLPADDFDEFYQATYTRLVAQLLAVLHDRPEAEDLAQEAFARACLHWRRVHAMASPEAWVRRVAFNLAFNSLRRARRKLRALARVEPPQVVADHRPERVDMQRAMGNVSPRHREVLVLRYGADLTVEEIATQLRLSTGTVKSRLARARTALAAQLREEEGVRHV